MHHVLWGAVEDLYKAGEDSSSLESSKDNVASRNCLFLEESSSSVTGEPASGASVALKQKISRMVDAHAETVQSSPIVHATTIELLKAANMWSQGAEKPGTDTCRPCVFVYMPKGCKDGPACDFCHAPHTSFAQKRAGKNRRQHCKRLLDAARVLNMQDKLDLFGRHSPHMQTH